ncbi:MAG TPA: aldehyde dehydrogenase family protein, partial [Pirellula sp.]|nr:aldehyde dehydrogenase family protein [Pirellula sp.]
AILAKLRTLLVESRHDISIAIESQSRQDYRETITSELMPLADATKWLNKCSKRVLAPRCLGSRGSPLWLGRLRSTVYRVPHGLVMIIGTWNYPLFLPGVQILHALAAGNAVVFKPAPGCDRVSQLLISLLVQAGVPGELIVILDSSIESARQAIAIGVDKVVMTGSSRSGRVVLHKLAESLTPAVMELSGCDAMYVLSGADMHRVCDLLVFGLRLNGGATCMAPRRVFVPKKSAEVFHRLLLHRLEEPNQKNWTTKLSPQTYSQLWDGIEDAIGKGARVFSGQSRRSPLAPANQPPEMIACGHLVLTDVTTDMQLCAADIFAPLAMIIPVEDWSDALRADSRCPYALSASIFGPLEDALRMVRFVSAGFVTINDVIVPTVDPRLPFGGRGESGFGVTRGHEGLLEMTVPKVVSTRLGSWLPHAKQPQPSDQELLDGLLQLSHHKSLRVRLQGLLQIVRAAMSQRRKSVKSDWN